MGPLVTQEPTGNYTPPKVPRNADESRTNRTDETVVTAQVRLIFPIS